MLQITYSADVNSVKSVIIYSSVINKTNNNVSNDKVYLKEVYLHAVVFPISDQSSRTCIYNSGIPDFVQIVARLELASRGAGEGTII